jgi:glutamine amidotransferase
VVTLINYGLGNILAIRNIYTRSNIPVQVASDSNELAKASKLVLPGVGAFDWAMSRLNDSGMRSVLDDLVLVRKVPILGICVGMQMMASSSEEGKLPGLGWIPGRVQRFNQNNFQTKTHLPHMGWNSILLKEHALFSGLHEPEFYFLHSYFFDPELSDSVLAQTNYGIKFASAVHRENIFGVQFHPEKSHDWGEQLLRNFANL